jgi:O-antigen/teichoic acid export membrane protein
VNLSVWYKLTDNTFIGALVSIAGAVITIILLTKLVPVYGYAGAAWATLVCYTFMVFVSYALGRKYFPVPYDLVKILSYILLCIAIWIIYVAYFEYQLLFMKITLFVFAVISLFLIDLKIWIKLLKR